MAESRKRCDRLTVNQQIHHHTQDRPHRHHYDAEMLSVEDARERILSYFNPLATIEVPLLDALGLTLAEDLMADFDIPPLANSAMDGYAVRASDVAAASDSAPVVLPVNGYVAAGYVADEPLAEGSAMRIMTGAPIPDGADTVVPFEDTDEDSRDASTSEISEIGIRLNAESGENIRPAGEDIQRGTKVVGKGAELTPGVVGVAASLGRTSVRVVRRPVVAIVSTGDEIVEPGEKLSPGKIYNSNAYSVASMAEKHGAIAKIVGTRPRQHRIPRKPTCRSS